MYTTENIISIYGHCIVMWRTIHNAYCEGHVHDKDYHIRIWALYRHLTKIYNLAYTYMSIHNVNYSAQMYLHANANLWEYTHTQPISYPYMVIFRSYTASVSYWLAPMYVFLVLTFNIALNMFTMLIILRRCIMHCIHIVVDVLAFKVKMYSLHSLYTCSLYSLYSLY